MKRVLPFPSNFCCVYVYIYIYISESFLLGKTFTKRRLNAGTECVLTRPYLLGKAGLKVVMNWTLLTSLFFVFLLLALFLSMISTLPNCLSTNLGLQSLAIKKLLYSSQQLLYCQTFHLHHIFRLSHRAIHVGHFLWFFFFFLDSM